MSGLLKAAAEIKADRERTVESAKNRMQSRSARLAAQNNLRHEELKQICRSLLSIAQKYVQPHPSSFSDYLDVIQSAKALQNLGVGPEIAENFQAVVCATGNEIVLKSAEYRMLRNKSIAGFATIADLTEKPAAAGTHEFQQGVREGYRRASDIATMFLDDISGGATKC
ncbi:hypothetical protein EBZ39_08845 [bacterium]|nr:hypothetical protein [bacterium]